MTPLPRPSKTGKGFYNSMIGNRGDSPIPDVCEPVLGFRTFNLIRSNETGKWGLYSPFYSVKWDKTIQAVCLSISGSNWVDLMDPPKKNAGPEHTSPEHDCACGIYCYYQQEGHSVYTTPSRIPVSGVIGLTGAIEVHAMGMRGEKAELYALALYDQGDHLKAQGYRKVSGRTVEEMDDPNKVIRQVTRELGVHAVPHRELRAYGSEYAKPLDKSLIPGKPKNLGNQA